MITHGSLPSTHASCPDGTECASPAPNSISCPASVRTRNRPEMTYPVCGNWQESVPTSGLTSADHLQPGWYVARPVPVAAS